MKRAWIVAAAVLASCGSGGSAGGPSKVTLALVEGTEVHAKTDQISSVYLVAFDAKGPVTFSVSDAPGYVTVSGSVLSIAPGRTDAGTWPMTVTATDGASSDSKRILLVVELVNSPPDLVTVYAVDSRFEDAYVYGCLDSARLWGTLSDLSSERDALGVEAEVVEDGQPFTGIPTHASSLSKDYRPGYGDRGFVDYELPLTGLVAGRRYRLAVRAADEFGAASAWHGPLSGKVYAMDVPQYAFSCTPFALPGSSLGLSVGAARGTTQSFSLDVLGAPVGAVTYTASGPYVSVSGSTLIVSPPASAPAYSTGWVMVTATDGTFSTTAYYDLNVW